MVTRAERPRLLTVVIVALLGFQSWLLVSAAVVAVRSPVRSAMVPLANSLTMVLLLAGMLVGQKHPRITWTLVALALASLVTSAFVIPRMQ